MTTIFENIGQLVTANGTEASEVIGNAALVVEDGVISSFSSGPVLLDNVERVDCGGCVVTPGLIDSHTHAVFGGWRAAEYELRNSGVGYMEIAARGGGINASVRDLAARSEQELAELTSARVNDMVRFGITTVEVKSGYGLNTEGELKQLRAIREAARSALIEIVPTFLGAHEFPVEYRTERSRYVDLLVNEMIPAVAQARLARFCDVFMEPGAFDGAQTRRILEAGLAHGLEAKLHADELENSGAAELAVELGAVSADHLGAVSQRGIEALAGSGTVATLLPGTLFFLGKKQYAPGRALIDAGVTVALATDFNPGSSPTSNLPLMMTFACSQMGLTPLEAIVAATAGGARALALPAGYGRIQAGAPADLVVWNVSDYREIPYRYGSVPIRGVWKRGRRVFH